MTPILLLKDLVTSAGPGAQGYLKEKFSRLLLQVQEFMKILKKFNILKSIYSRYQDPTLFGFLILERDLPELLFSLLCNSSIGESESWA